MEKSNGHTRQSKKIYTSGCKNARINHAKHKIITASHIFSCIAAIIAVTLTGFSFESLAKLKGDGSELTPYQADTLPETGDSFLMDKYVRNFTCIDNAIIRIQADYEPKDIELIIDADGGSFSDGSNKIDVNTKYGSALSDIFGNLSGDNAPRLNGKAFSGWYIKGNHKLAEERSGIKTAGDLGDALYTENLSAAYLLIDPDDAADKEAADIDESGSITARALWRADTVPCSDDGCDADDGAADKENEDLDIWDKERSNNKALEYVDDLSTKEQYTKLHGTTRYQYGRAIFNAETGGARHYSWYVKREADADYKMLTENDAVLKLSNLKRTDNHAKVRCVVDIDENAGAQLTYETELTVFSLPKIDSLKFCTDGDELSIEKADKT